LIYVLPKF